MSAEVMEMLARRWHCSVADVRDRIGARLQRAGLIDKDSTAEAYDGRPVSRVYTLGVTDDDRIAVLDDDDRPILWLE